MAAIASTRILALQATSPRLTPVPIAATTPIVGGGTIGGVRDTANTANTTANTAISGLTGKLDNAASNIIQTGFYLKTSGYDAGSGFAIYNGGLVAKTSGVNTFTLDYGTGAANFAGALSAASGTFAGALSAASGTFAGALSAASGTFAGTLDCLNGATIRTQAVSTTAVNDMVLFKESGGNTFGTIKQGGIYSSGFPGGEVSFNFSQDGGSGIGVTNTANGYGCRFTVTSSTKPAVGFSTGGPYTWYWVPYCDGSTHTNLGADLLDGYHASSFSQTSHNHSGVYAPLVHTHWITDIYPSDTVQANFEFSTDGGVNWTAIRLRRKTGP